jgi:hypothetical protein
VDFSAGLLDFLPKKSFFVQKAIKDFFGGTDGFWDVFRESDRFFRGRIWQFWWIRAHSFPSKRWKSHQPLPGIVETLLMVVITVALPEAPAITVVRG